MKKTNIINMMINLARFALDAVSFNTFMTYLSSQLYGKLRLFIEEKVEQLEVSVILSRDDDMLEAQLDKCRRLDVLVTDLYVESLVSSP